MLYFDCSANYLRAKLFLLEKKRKEDVAYLSYFENLALARSLFRCSHAVEPTVLCSLRTRNSRNEKNMYVILTTGV